MSQKKSMTIKSQEQLVKNTAESWESRELGCDEQFVRVASKKVADQIDDALDLQMISIRLSRELIETYKLLGIKHGMGYQPLMREALKRFADGELKMIAKELLEAQTKFPQDHLRKRASKKVA
jgi:predicted DNA binding CopG/RHH family protein